VELTRHDTEPEPTQDADDSQPDSSSESSDENTPASFTSHMTNQQAADYRYRGRRQAIATKKHMTSNWVPASMGNQSLNFTTRKNADEEHDDEDIDFADIDKILKKDGVEDDNGPTSLTPSQRCHCLGSGQWIVKWENGDTGMEGMKHIWQNDSG
jgi:hypothetical protein